jgi:TRAP-type mannitol/chloroaromatic compound transport system substrate-binding protein
MIYGGGKDLQNEIYAKHGMFSLDCNMIGPETSGWFRKKIESLDDLKGIKMRFLGLGAQVMQKLGVSTQLLSAGDIYPALERGVIDATEFSMPNMDIDLGFHQIAKFNYYPGWHQQSSIGELLMNKTAWDALSEQNKAILETSCGHNVHVNFAETEAKNPAAMNKMKSEYGVENVRWTDEELAAFEKAWHEVLAENSAKDAEFKKIADSYLAFRKEYKTWGDAQALKPTYLTE